MAALTIQNRQGDRLEIWVDPTTGGIVFDAVTATDAWCLVLTTGQTEAVASLAAGSLLAQLKQGLCDDAATGVE